MSMMAQTTCKTMGSAQLMGILHPVILRSLHLQPEGEGMEEEEEEGNVSHPKAEEVLWYDHMKHFHKIDT